MTAGRWKTPLVLGVVVSPILLAGCSQSTGKLTEAISVSPVAAKPYAASVRDRECLARAMFFESNRSSRDGLVAVGSVVMNRLKSGKYGNTVCDVVGAKGQFAPGVMTRKMNSKALPEVTAAADAVIKGERHPKVKEEVMFFHTAGLKFPYKNMHYVVVAGGNSFYEKRGRRKAKEPVAPEAAQTMIASAEPATQQAVLAMAEQPMLPQTVSLLQAAPAPQPHMVAMAEPAPAPKGARLARAPKATLPADYEPAEMPAPQQAMMSFDASPQAADAIGAMILNQDRPPE